MHTSPSGKVYIGITCKTPEARWGVGGNGYAKHPYFWNAIKKYGWDTFKHEILLEGLSKEDACDKEREYIKRYCSNNPDYGYNLTTGGDAGYEMSEQSIAIISARAKRQWQEMTQEEKDARALRKMEIEAERTNEEWKAITNKAQQTIRERYTPEERREQYKRAAEKCKATKAAKGGRTPEECAAISERMKKYWEAYHILHPKKKKRYLSPKVRVKLSHEEMLARRGNAIRQKWLEPEFREKMMAIAERRKGQHFTLSEETKANMRKPKSEETKMKMRKPKSPETRRKMSEAKKKYHAEKALLRQQASL